MTKELFALKKIDKQRAELRELVSEVKNERRILQYIKKQSNIVNMKSAWADKQHYYMLFEYALNGDLTAFMKKYGR